MKSIRSKTKLEDVVCKQLWKRGIRFRRNVRDLFGKPDIAIKKCRVVIFLDSCFWHYCPIHGHIPKSNIDYWKSKIERNVNRDKEVTQFYKDSGWHILRIWEHQIKDDLDEVVNVIIDFIENAKKSCNKKTSSKVAFHLVENQHSCLTESNK